MPRKSYIRTDEHKRKISQTLMGHCVSKETREKLRITHKGKKMPFGHREKMRLIRLGKSHSEETKMKMRGNKNPMKRPEVREKVTGQNNCNWKGGITPIRTKIWYSQKHKIWRQSVFIRDNFICRKCNNNKSDKLEAHHIKPVKKLLEEAKEYMPLLNLYDAAMIYTPLWNIDNGITLCRKCHDKTKKGRGK